VVNFVSDGHLQPLEIGQHESEGGKVIGVPEGPLEVGDVVENFRQHEPVIDDGKVEAQLEEEVAALQHFPLDGGGVFLIEFEDFVEDGEKDVDQKEHHPGVLPEELVVGDGDEEAEVVGEAGR
jgi:hypothetical protein